MSPVVRVLDSHAGISRSNTAVNPSIFSPYYYYPVMEVLSLKREHYPVAGSELNKKIQLRLIAINNSVMEITYLVYTNYNILQKNLFCYRMHFSV